MSSQRRDRDRGLRVLGGDDVERLLPLDDGLAIAERAYRDLGERRSLASPRLTLAADAGAELEFALKSWHVLDPASGVAAVRLQPALLRVERYGRRAVGSAAGPSERAPVGYLLLFALEDGHLLGLVEERAVGALETSLSVAVACDRLARRDATTLTVLGAGEQARRQVAAVARVRRFDAIRVFTPVQADRDLFARALADAVGVAAGAVEDAAAAARTSDVVLAATSALIPVVAEDAVAEGVHVSATRPTEVAASVLRSADIVVSAGGDSAHVAALGNAGALWRERSEPDAAAAAKAVALADVVAGTAPGRTSPAQVTVYTPLLGPAPGVVAAALAAEALRRAEQENLGRRLALDELVR